MKIFEIVLNSYGDTDNWMRIVILDGTTIRTTILIIITSEKCNVIITLVIVIQGC